MSPRRLALPLAGLLGAAVAVVPAIATGTTSPSAASFTAVDYAWHANAGAANSATIAEGGTATISYPQGFSAHNADFGTGPHPSSCTQTAGPSSGAVPPLPHAPSSPGWSGTCTFNAAGTYTFHCDLHGFMTATIRVVASPPPTTSTTTTGTTTTGTTTTDTTTTSTIPTGTTTTAATATTETGTSSGPTSAEPGTTAVTSTTPNGPQLPTEPTVPVHPAPVAKAASAITIGALGHGRTIHGSARVSTAGAGGRLDVYVFAPPRSLGSRAGRWILVGRLVRAHLAAGTARFSVPLTGGTDRTLGGRRLTVVVGVIVRSAHASTAWTIRRFELLSSA